jgi:hypothetical protein
MTGKCVETLQGENLEVPLDIPILTLQMGELG